MHILKKGFSMDNKDWSRIFQAVGLLAQLGIVMVVNIGVGFLLGSWIDSLLSDSIIFRIIGLILGILSGFYSNYRLIKVFIDNNKVE